MRGARAAAAVLAIGMALSACPSSAPEGESLCEPGENIFCRCPGGDAGTKRCNAAGDGFGECEVAAGVPCAERSASKSSSSGGEQPGSALYSACAGDEQCESGHCPMGFCTQPCTEVDDCLVPLGECVRLGDQQRCLPRCSEQAECDAYGCTNGGVCSQCGFARALDHWGVTACADWGSDLELPPIGSACDSSRDCNLGHEGVERVCGKGTGVCAAGCHLDSDCPPGEQCSSTGALGLCF